MPQQPRHRYSQTPTTRHLYQLIDGYTRFVEDVWSRSWHIASASLRQTIQEVQENALREWNPGSLASRLLGEYANYLSGIAVSVPAAVELAAERIGDATAHPPATLMRELPGKWPGAPSRPFALPARFIDASQGWALYVVPSEVATSVLGAQAAFVKPFELGGGRTLLAVLGVDYRVSDFGRYTEIALALAVTPRGDRAGLPGPMFVGIAVSDESSREPARLIWGLHKICHPDLAASCRPDRVRFGLAPPRPGTLAITFPRFGAGRSDRIPIFVYSCLGGDGMEEVTPIRSLISRSGSGEGTQVGGSVSIQLGRENAAECLCKGFAEVCLCRTLMRFEIKDRLPAANGWTEHLSGTFNAPQELSLSRSEISPDRRA